MAMIDHWQKFEDNQMRHPMAVHNASIRVVDPYKSICQNLTSTGTSTGVKITNGPVVPD